MFAQRPSFRFLATGGIISLFILTFLFFAHRSRDTTSRYILKAHRPAQSECSTSITPQNGSNNTWEFRVERDGQNHGLSDEQCRSAFPKLFLEIDKSAGLRRESPISYKDLDSREVEDGMVRAIIDRGEVSWTSTCTWYISSNSNNIHFSSTLSILAQCPSPRLEPAQPSTPSSALYQPSQTDTSSPASNSSSQLKTLPQTQPAKAPSGPTPSVMGTALSG